MNRLRVVVLLAALFAAALAAYLAKGILTKEVETKVAAAPPPVVTVDVLFAARDLAPGEKLASGALQWRPWPRDSVGSFISRETRPGAMEELAEARARQPIYTDEPIIEKKLVKAENGSFLSAVLPKGMRAISVAISEHSAVSGFILPNDRVDVIMTRKYDGVDGGGGNAVLQKHALTETILSNVRVLAVNQSFRAPDGDGATVPEGRTAVLELDPYQTEIITKAEALGELSLSLRSLAEGGPGGLKDARPELSSAFKGKEEKPKSGPLIVRYGVESSVSNP